MIAAHVDSPTGPAVFLRLRGLQPGDVVEVTDEAGGVHDATAQDELRLITCGEVFDAEAASYTDNRVVYAVAGAG